jgi:hypothetical protein
MFKPTGCLDAKFSLFKMKPEGLKMVNQKENYAFSGKPYWRGRLSTVDLLELTSLDHLVFILKRLFSLYTKQVTLMRRLTVLSLPPLLIFPGQLVQIRCL